MTHSTLRNFECTDELWNSFLESIEGDYDSASQAIRSLMRKYIRKKNRQKARKEA